MPVLRACPGCRGLRSAVNVKLLLSTRKSLLTKGWLVLAKVI